MEQKTSALERMRHSAAHLLAHAVSELYPETQLTLGPPTKDGFFYDFLPKENFKEAVLLELETHMRKIAERKLPLTHEQMPKTQARELYKGNPFKLELIDGIPGDTVGIARQGNFTDLCKGGHVKNTGEIKHFKLLNISGSYWRADRSGQALQRISGTAFVTAKEFRKYEKLCEDAKKYDHRRLGKQQDLFSFHEEGPGFPFFHPKGTLVLNVLTHYLRSLLEHANYLEIKTPTMLSSNLWKQSGHYAHYKENMYFCEIEKREFAVKPMNCPGAILIYNERPRSYRELPLRLAEFGHVHRNELSGVLHGLFRVRAFTQDDGHIYCTSEQIEDEVFATIEMTRTVLKKFDFEDIRVAVSTKPKKAMGTDKQWDTATQALQKALEHANMKFVISEGEGAFYGPKIEFLIKDSMGREWQCSTIQVDFSQPENFDLNYIASSGKKERPVMIHRAIYGSFERFFGILLEHYKGNLPLWLAPVQAKVLTITDEQKPYALSILNKLKGIGMRATIDESSDPISGKIKTAQLEKVPWMLVLGQKEVDNQTITLRHRSSKQEFGLTLEQLLEKAESEGK